MLPFFQRLVCGAACVLLSGALSTAHAAECQHRLNLSRADMPEARVLETLLTCAQETRAELSALTARVADLERTVTGHERQLQDPPALLSRVGELERMATRHDRTLEGLDARVERAVTAALRELERTVTQQGLSLEGLDERIARVVTAAMRDVERTVTQHDRTIEGLEARVARAMTAAMRDVETALLADIHTLRTEIRDPDDDTEDVARLTRRLDRISDRQWAAVPTGRRSLGQTLINDLDYPIVVSATVTAGVARPCHARLKVDGVTVAETKAHTDSAEQACFITATVPPGASYMLESPPQQGARPEVARWSELR